jgi:hypothetical protein
VRLGKKWLVETRKRGLRRPSLASAFGFKCDSPSEEKRFHCCTPLRLADAIEIAFPMRGMTIAGLRREPDRNRLAIEKTLAKTLQR